MTGRDGFREWVAKLLDSSEPAQSLGRVLKSVVEIWRAATSVVGPALLIGGVAWIVPGGSTITVPVVGVAIPRGGPVIVFVSVLGLLAVREWYDIHCEWP